MQILRLLEIGGFNTKRRHIGSDESFTQSVTRAHSSYELGSEDVTSSWQDYLEPLSPGEPSDIENKQSQKEYDGLTLNQ